MKWEPVVGMIALTGVGAWLVYQGRAVVQSPDTRKGAALYEAEIVGVKGYIEVVPAADAPGPAGTTYRWMPSGRPPTEIMSDEEFRQTFGDAVRDAVSGGGPPAIFRLLNISGWGSLVWVTLGFLAQVVFASRFIVQWIASERRKEAYVPEIFWWISLFGGISLFVYFVWRRDIVGVCGQSSGIVIYLRNLRLIYKKRRRDAQAAIPPPPPPGSAGEG